MSFLFEKGPIVACSSGRMAFSAISLLRLSGFEKLEDLQSFFSRKLVGIPPRKQILTDILKEKEVLDKALLSFFPAPRSYTGENMLELSIHGNPLNVERILQLFVDKGFRHAMPGEFTYRAVKNEKMTLSQAEGLDLLLRANSNLALNQGLQILYGDLAAQYKKLHGIHTRLKASIELSIDFSDDVGEEVSRREQEKYFREFSLLISSLDNRAQNENSSLINPSIVLLGEANGGKSSLFNAILKRDRSIVSANSGTTRDYISEAIHFRGVNFSLIDTAGMNETFDTVEKEGIAKACQVIKTGFFRVLLLNPLQSHQEQLDKLSKVSLDILGITHMDLPEAFEKLKELKLPRAKKIIILNPAKLLKKNLGSIEPELGPIGPKAFSVESGPIGPKAQFVSDTEEILHMALEKFQSLQAKEPLLIDRHCKLINLINYNFNNLWELWKKSGDMAVISSELDILGEQVSQLVGIVSVEDVLEHVFSNFCIGK
ncbi:MAG: GTP-binding protein [Halobacteriovoraceae bacterium]|nr:GTP-binding protein [Halobacteriovoraceae bacterium]